MSLVLTFHMFCHCQAGLSKQAEFLAQLKNSLSGNWSDWNNNSGQQFCSYKGVGCDDSQAVIMIDISNRSLSGKFPENVCSYMPQLQVLRLGHNNLQGDFPRSLTNCSFLEELNITSNHLTGKLPDFSPLKSLRWLDLSYNQFVGDFPLSFTNLSNLEFIYLNENHGFNIWELPESISRLTKLKSLILISCRIKGKIPSSIGNLTSLVSLQLSGNYLQGQLPSELGKLKNLKQIDLYYNQLQGEVPEELGNLTEINEIDMSVNKFTKIPESIFFLPKLRFLQLYNNSLTGEIPASFGNSTTLELLSLYENFLTGKIPPNLGKSSPLIGFDLSENQLSGELPAEACNGGKLMYFLVLGNMISGGIPESYANCEPLLRFRVSHNNLQGEIPEGLFGLPHMSILDVAYNHLTGPISSSIKNAKNLSELCMQNNMITGGIPPEISKATNLVKIELGNNLLSGPIPSEIGDLKQLNSLLLQGNKFGSSIPSSLSSLKSLNVLDLSSNLLQGSIPESLSELLPNSMNFSNNMLSGPIPPSFVTGGVLESFAGNPGLCLPTTSFNTSGSILFPCSKTHYPKKINYFWVIGATVAVVGIGIVVCMKHWFKKKRPTSEQEDSMSLSFFSYDIKSFHRLTFDQREITECLIDDNIVGYGGSGSVYRIVLSTGEVVAVKKLWSRKTKYSVQEGQLAIARELKTEVETLGSIRHKNIVKLYSYFSSVDCSLLIYEYMTNGNLWEALHGGKVLLNWPARYQIALGIAQGLAYLHHDLMPPIIHRDIKSNNILLDVDFQPKVADFGIAKVLQATGGKDSSTTVIAGTYGYLAPEYAYSSKATAKCDVYSFGVVLLEILTGKKPVEAEFGENKNIVYWISTKVETKEAWEVIDKRISGPFKDDMIKVLRIAILCTCKSPSYRPTMDEVVQQLIEADPYRFDSCQSFSQIKGNFNVSKPKNANDL